MSSERPGRSGALVAVLGLVLALAFLPYVPALGNGYALDDVWQVETNQAVHDLGNVGGLFLSPYAVGMNPRRSPYRPVTTVTYALDWAFGGGSPLPFHLTNVLLHMAACVALLFLLVALGAPIPAAAAGTALFAVHPVHVEAVANIVGRADVLATLFVLLGALAYVSRWPATLRAAVVGAAYLLALGSKEVGVTLPGLLIVIEAVRCGCDVRGLGRALWKERWIYAASAVALAGYLGARLAVLGMVGTYDVAPYIAVLPAGTRVITAMANLSEVARLLAFPLDLSADYGPAVILPAGLDGVRFWVGALVGAGSVALGVLAFRRGAPLVGAGLLWMAVALLPIANVVLPVPIWIAERTLYLPSVGAMMVLTGTGLWLLHRGWGGPRRAAVWLATVLVILGTARSWTRSRTWQDTDAVLTTLADEHPESFRAQWWVAGRLVEAGNVDRGLELMEGAVRLNPNDAFIRLDHVRLLLVAARPAEAEERLREIPEGMSPSWDAYLVQSLADRGLLEEARDAVRRGLERFPGHELLSRQAAALGALDPSIR